MRADSVVVTSGANSWSFDRVIVASGGWSRQLLPQAVADNVQTHRNYLTWFVARRPAEFIPDRFPVFIRIVGDKSMNGARTIDGSTVKATLDGRRRPASGPADIRKHRHSWSAHPSGGSFAQNCLAWDGTSGFPRRTVPFPVAFGVTQVGRTDPASRIRSVACEY
jgi:hypothetical protein